MLKNNNEDFDANGLNNEEQKWDVEISEESPTVYEKINAKIT